MKIYDLNSIPEELLPSVGGKARGLHGPVAEGGISAISGRGTLEYGFNLKPERWEEYE